ncbi:ESX secretion-associated protein EspG [Rhodococcus rhodnii]|uniref:ESX secretion-associated protein EspG n=2 Tax=Rhodococcus rhodnii TaxID=38312 RepID=R7WSI6_9NOCA|nr:ESX secretion-associated protein EspG [Rhodococcus rhodnii]EOM78261.1 hypothetical protein Rrhod_0346 [Rhodococcus rhodnii LMG 5362]
MTSWAFDPLTYQVAWRAFGVDRPHYPFQYRSTSETTDEYERECLQAATGFRSRLDDDLYWAFATMLDPEARVYICGFSGAGDAEKIRSYIAVRGPRAVVMRQDPGPDHHSGGAVHLAGISFADCGASAVRALPPAAPGRRPRIDAELRDLDRRDEFDADASWLRAPDARATPAQRFERILGLPRTSAGRIEVYSGATISERATGPAREVRWVDLADDGRYLVISNSRTVSLLPGPDESLGNHIHKLVGAAIDDTRSEPVH